MSAMSYGLENRVALVAAASSGLGKAAAMGLAREGARVCLCSREAERAEAAAKRKAAREAKERAAKEVAAKTATEAV